MQRFLIILALLTVIIIWPKEKYEPVAVSEPYEPAQNVTPSPAPASEWLEEQALKKETEATIMAKVIFGEARGVYSLTEQACVAWTILNRVDAGYGNITEVATAPHQFCYNKDFPTVDDYGRNILVLVYDILDRWEAEQSGESDVGRVLPADYFWFHGDGKHNYFRNVYDDYSQPWEYELGSPYEE